MTYHKGTRKCSALRVYLMVLTTLIELSRDDLRQ